MSRRRWIGAGFAVFLAVIAFGYIKADEPEEEYGDSLYIMYFEDAAHYKVRLIDIPSGDVAQEITDDVESTLGDAGVALAKKFPKVWLYEGCVTKSDAQPPTPEDIEYFMQYFKFEYLGSVKVRVPIGDVEDPSEMAAGTPPPPPDSGGGEVWGEGPDDDDPPDSDGNIEDDPEEPDVPPVPMVDAFLHVWKFIGKK